MNASKPASGRPWALYSTYLRLIVCFLLLPLLVTGFVLVPEARLDFVATVLICTCCLYIDRDTVVRFARGRSKGVPANDERDASS
jgi:hypothetical protein